MSRGSRASMNSTSRRTPARSSSIAPARISEWSMYTMGSDGADVPWPSMRPPSGRRASSWRGPRLTINRRGTRDWTGRESPGDNANVPHSRSTPDEAVTPERLRHLARLRRVRDRIDREYSQPLDVEALARGVPMSAGHLSREFKLAYGESPYRYLMTRRIERAMALLRRDDLSVTEVCFEVGCTSLGTFSTRFTELV